jgi:hypothetical protein
LAQVGFGLAKNNPAFTSRLFDQTLYSVDSVFVPAEIVRSAFDVVEGDAVFE